MRSSIPKYVLFSCVVALVAACAALRRAGYTAAAAGGGAILGAPGGPLLSGALAAGGAVAAQSVGENDELRDGETIGKGALEDQLRRQNDALKAENERYRLTIAELERRKPTTVHVPEPFIPRWLWVVAALVVLWLKGHHILRALKERSLKPLMGTLAPSWAFSKKKQPGV